MNYFDAHAPFLPPAPFAGRYSGKQAEDYRSGREINIGALTAEMKLPPDSVLDGFVDAYDESVLSLDAAIGALFAELERRGCWNDPDCAYLGPWGKLRGPQFPVPWP